MALVTGSVYRGAHEGYLYYIPQDEKFILPDTVADPALLVVDTPVGISPFPSASHTSNQQPVQGIGSGRAMNMVAGRRESTIRVSQMQFADGTFLLNALRDHSDPDDAATVKGLPLFACEYGTDANYGAAGAIAEQGIDCLINTMRLDAAENQPLAADLEIWPHVILPQDAPLDDPAFAAANILLWQHLSWTVDGGDDLHPILSRVSLSVSNNLSREGMRQVLLDVDEAEIALSRTPYVIVPHIETIQVQYTLRDRIPSALRTADDWGEVVLTAAQPGSGAGRGYFTATISHNFLNTESFQQAAANQQLAFTVDVPAYAVTFDAGLTLA